MKRTKKRSFITISGTVRRGWLDVQQKRWKKSVGDMKFLITMSDLTVVEYAGGSGIKTAP
jgi:hypothetical protein